MALTEREQQMLERLEKQFKEDDPQFAPAMEPNPGPTSSTGRVGGGVLMTVTGFVLLLFGRALQNPDANLIIGLTGFATMVTGPYVATKRLYVKQAPGLKKAKTTGSSTATSPNQASKDTFSNAAWWALLFWWV